MTDVSAIFKAIAAVAADVGTLGKGAFNQHGGYKFVSIDKYYETVGLSAAKQGLSWVLAEKELQLRPDMGSKGMLHITYTVNVFHSNGAFIPNFSQVSIIHPIQGAQTIGSAMSYADKVVMRQLFHITTGEEDADSTNPGDIDIMAPTQPTQPTKRQAAPAQKTEAPKAEVPKITDIPGEDGNWDTVVAVFKKFIPDCQTEKALREFWVENGAALNALKDGHPTAFEEVKALFTERKTKLKG